MFRTRSTIVNVKNCSVSMLEHIAASMLFALVLILGACTGDTRGIGISGPTTSEPLPMLDSKGSFATRTIETNAIRCDVVDARRLEKEARQRLVSAPDDLDALCKLLFLAEARGQREEMQRLATRLEKAFLKKCREWKADGEYSLDQLFVWAKFLEGYWRDKGNRNKARYYSKVAHTVMLADAIGDQPPETLDGVVIVLPRKPSFHQPTTRTEAEKLADEMQDRLKDRPHDLEALAGLVWALEYLGKADRAWMVAKRLDDSVRLHWLGLRTSTPALIALGYYCELLSAFWKRQGDLDRARSIARVEQEVQRIRLPDDPEWTPVERLEAMMATWALWENGPPSTLDDFARDEGFRAYVEALDQAGRWIQAHASHPGLLRRRGFDLRLRNHSHDTEIAKLETFAQSELASPTDISRQQLSTLLLAVAIFQLEQQQPRVANRLLTLARAFMKGSLRLKPIADALDRRIRHRLSQEKQGSSP